IKPNIGLIIAAADDSRILEPDKSSIDDLKEQINKSEKLFEETRTFMSSHNIRVKQFTHSTHSTESTGFIDIEKEPVEDPLLPIDVEKLDEEYSSSKETIGGLLIHSSPAADQTSINSREPWIVSTFIVAPIKWLFRSLYNGVREAIGYIGKF